MICIYCKHDIDPGSPDFGWNNYPDNQIRTVWWHRECFEVSEGIIIGKPVTFSKSW